MSDEGDRSKLFATTDFGYRKITVERPLRLNFQANPGAVGQDERTPHLQALAAVSKKNEQEQEAEETGGRARTRAHPAMLATLPTTRYLDRLAFEQALERAYALLRCSCPHLY